jgi:serine/threonine-protein kinase RsbW
MPQANNTGFVNKVIPSDANQGMQLLETIMSQLACHPYTERDVFSIRLALEEAILNAIKHGNRYDRHKSVLVSYRIQHDRFDISITDEGPGYRPEAVPDPTADENLERPGGRGLLLMRYYMTEVTVHPPGNRLTMVKYSSASAAPSSR